MLGVLLAAGAAALSGCHPGSAAAKRLGAACESGDSRACDSLGGRLRRGEHVLRDEARAATLFDGACKAGVGESCASLGAMLQEAPEGKRDSARALTLFRQACERRAMDG
jgi:TPR repeat protein